MGENSAVDHECVPDTFTKGTYMAKFASTKEGIEGCVDLYVRKYLGLPSDKLVSRWAQTDSDDYHSSVKTCFSSAQ